MMRALTAAETAALLGRQPRWLADNWQLWHKAKKFPRPIQEHGTLVWDAAQVFAWLDRDLSPQMRATAAAFRAALTAAGSSSVQIEDELAAWRRRLNRQGVPS